MSDRFTSDVRRALSLAQEESRRFRHHYLGTEHLLLGLIQVEQAAPPLADVLGLDLGTSRELVRSVIGMGQAEPHGHTPFTHRAKEALSSAHRNANRLRHVHIGLQHLLMGLLDVEDSTANVVLRESGADPADLRRQLSGSTRQEPNSYLELAVHAINEAAEVLRILAERDHGPFIDDSVVRFVIGQQLVAAGVDATHLSILRRETTGERTLHVDLAIGDPPYVGLLLDYPKGRETEDLTRTMAGRMIDATSLPYPVLVVQMLSRDHREILRQHGADWPGEAGATGTIPLTEVVQQGDRVHETGTDPRIELSCLARHDTGVEPMLVFGLVRDAEPVPG